MKRIVLPDAFSDLNQELQKLVTGQGIQVGGWFIEHEHRRVGQESQGQGQPLFHAAGERTDRLAGRSARPTWARTACARGGWHMLETTIELRGSQRSQVVVKGEFLGHIAELRRASRPRRRASKPLMLMLPR